MTLSTSAVAVCRSGSDFAQLAKQSRVLNSNDGLAGKVLHQFNLLVGKGTNLLTINSKNTNQFVVLEHWDIDEGSELQDWRRPARSVRPRYKPVRS